MHFDMQCNVYICFTSIEKHTEYLKHYDYSYLFLVYIYTGLINLTCDARRYYDAIKFSGGDGSIHSRIYQDRIVVKDAFVNPYILPS